MLAQSQSEAAAEVSTEWNNSSTKDLSPSSSPTPTTVTPPDFGEPAVLSEGPADGETFAVMYIPRFGENSQRNVAGGVGVDVLNSNRIGVGHYSNTALPGELGNFAVAGHRNAFGGAMKEINELRVGDPIYVQTEQGWYTYRFRNLEFVPDTAVSVLDSIPQRPGSAATSRLITLTSCNPLFSTAERIIAYGVFESWRPAEAGPPVAVASDVASWNQ